MRILGASWWDVLSAIGTIAAVLLSLVLALQSQHRSKDLQETLDSERKEREFQERRRVASLVSAWTESTYIPSTDGTHYNRSVIAYVANFSSEPVFNVQARFFTGSSRIPIGPLSTPIEISVLPSSKTRHWDISIGLMGHSLGSMEIPSEPLVSITFTDSMDRVWERSETGVLALDPTSEGPVFSEDGLPQLGSLDIEYNPQQVALAFFDAVTGATSMNDLGQYLAPSATKWFENPKQSLANLKSSCSSLNIAAHVFYPADRIAYIRLIDDAELADTKPSDVYHPMLMTLVFLSGKGWRIFGFGGGVFQPDEIKFPRRDLLKDIRS